MPLRQSSLRRLRGGLKIRLRERGILLEVLAIELTDSVGARPARAVCPGDDAPPLGPAHRGFAVGLMRHILNRFCDARRRDFSLRFLLGLRRLICRRRFDGSDGRRFLRRRSGVGMRCGRRLRRGGSRAGGCPQSAQRCLLSSLPLATRWVRRAQRARPPIPLLARPRLAPPPRPRRAPAPQPRRRAPIALAIITPGRRRLRRPSGALRRAGLKATIEGLRRRNRDGSGIAGDELQRCGDGRQAHERFVVDAEGGEHAESAAQRHDRGNHRRDHQADIRKHSTSPNPRAIRSSTHHKGREIIARAYCVRAGRGPAPDASPDRRRFDRRIQHLRRLRESLKNQQEKFAGRPRC